MSWDKNGLGSFRKKQMNELNIRFITTAKIQKLSLMAEESVKTR